MKRSIAVVATLLSIASLGFFGCSKKNAEVKSNADSEKISGKLMIYTSTEDEFVSEIVNRFNQKYPGMEASYYRSGTEEVMSKLNAEIAVGNVQADLIMISDFATMESLKSQNMLVRYDSPELKNIDNQYVDKEHMYYGVFPTADGIMYNTDLVNEAPKTWADLITTDKKGQVVMASPLYSGAACNWLLEITRVPELGWDYIKALKANDVKVVKGNGGVVNSVSSGECKYGIVVESNGHAATKNGAPVQFIYPEDGYPTIGDPIAILSTTKNLSAAQKYLDFMLSEEIQGLGRDKYGRVSLRNGMELPPEVMPMNKRKLFLTDPKVLFAGRDNDKATYSEIFK